MIVNSLDVVIEPADLQKLLSGAVGEIERVKELKVSLEPGVVLLGGKISLGLTIPFKTKWRVQPAGQGRSLCLKLKGVSVGVPGMGEEMIATQVISLLRERLQGYDAVSVVERDILVDLDKVLSARGVVLTSPLRSIDVSTDGIELKVF